MAWQGEYPQLSEALLALDDAQLDALGEEPVLLDWVSVHLPGGEDLKRWEITPFSGDVVPMAKFVDVGIRGRKVTQITRFASACKDAFHSSKSKILDWCSGKGHLAKQLHHVTGSDITCLEFNGYLCECGEMEAKKHGFPIHFVEQDVLKPISKKVMDDVKIHTALHACGDLHLSMLDNAVENQAEQLALSPCCYHLTRQPEYRPLSDEAKSCPLKLSPTDLRLAVSQIVTAGKRVRRLRRQELVWRIAFDLLHRKVTGVDCYRSTPSIQKQWLTGSFEDFCHLMAERIGMDLPEVINTDSLITQAEQKYRQISRLEKARLAFRKAMEYYLVLDRVLWLEAQGYEVDLKLFCDAEVTPRNIMIHGIRKINASLSRTERC